MASSYLQSSNEWLGLDGNSIQQSRHNHVGDQRPKSPIVSSAGTVTTSDDVSEQSEESETNDNGYAEVSAFAKAPICRRSSMSKMERKSCNNIISKSVPDSERLSLQHEQQQQQQQREEGSGHGKVRSHSCSAVSKKNVRKEDMNEEELFLTLVHEEVELNKLIEEKKKMTSSRKKHRDKLSRSSSSKYKDKNKDRSKRDGQKDHRRSSMVASSTTIVPEVASSKSEDSNETDSSPNNDQNNNNTNNDPKKATDSSSKTLKKHHRRASVATSTPVTAEVDRSKDKDKKHKDKKKSHSSSSKDKEKDKSSPKEAKESKRVSSRTWSSRLGSVRTSADAKDGDTGEGRRSREVSPLIRRKRTNHVDDDYGDYGDNKKKDHKSPSTSKSEKKATHKDGGEAKPKKRSKSPFLWRMPSHQLRKIPSLLEYESAEEYSTSPANRSASPSPSCQSSPSSPFKRRSDSKRILQNGDDDKDKADHEIRSQEKKDSFKAEKDYQSSSGSPSVKEDDNTNAPDKKSPHPPTKAAGLALESLAEDHVSRSVPEGEAEGPSAQERMQILFLEQRKKERAKRLESVRERVRKQNAEQARPVLTGNELRKCVYNWYTRLGMPSRKDFQDRVRSMQGVCCEITEQDVDVLPWSQDGRRVNIRELFAKMPADFMLSMSERKLI